MSERKIATAKTACSCRNDRRQYVADQLGGLPAARSLVGAAGRGRGYLDWNCGLATLKAQTVVKPIREVSKVSKKNKNKSGGSKPRKVGRPSSSSDVRLSPHFRSPLDIERLGKALVAIALRTTAQLDDEKEASDAMED